MILMMAIEQDWDDLNMAIAYFQKIDDESSLLSVPVVCSQRINFGGGCEMTMHADKVVAAAETLHRFSRNWSG